MHRFTVLAWWLGVIHSLGEGTDAGQTWFLAMTAIAVVPALVLFVARVSGVAGPRRRSPAAFRSSRRGARVTRAAAPARPRAACCGGRGPAFPGRARRSLGQTALIHVDALTAPAASTGPPGGGPTRWFLDATRSPW